MATYKQAGRPVSVDTPLGRDVFLLAGFEGQEAISELFHFHLDLLAENSATVDFDKLLGQKITVEMELRRGKKRYFSGICSRLQQKERDTQFTTFTMEIVPECWILGKKVQSRIFQQVAIPDVLKEVLQGLTVNFELKGKYEPRNYCVQYRESDLDFLSRLMEEEGIFYFFKHTDKGHTMVVADSPQSHPDLPSDSHLIYETAVGGTRNEDRVLSWGKSQELRSGLCTLRDHCFELPGNDLEVSAPILGSVMVGRVDHKLKTGGNDKFEVYNFPGGYVRRFDGVDPGGGDQSGELQKISRDGERTVEIRMDQETLPGLVVAGSSNCRQMVSGYKFELDRHFNANGEYLLTSISHSGKMSGQFRTGGDSDFAYENKFTCIPFALHFRPARTTPKPVVQGSQTALVVGPKGEEIFTDKYGRVKVQFFWDRKGKKDEKSSCWVRVGTPWAGKQWGMVHIPRIGQEVIVNFLEGDPDQPIIVGSVYNAEMMPPYTLPENKTQSGIKSRSSPKGGADLFNELRFEDKKDSEDIYFHAQKDFHRVVENDDDLKVHNNRTVLIEVGNDSLTIKAGNQTAKINQGKSETEAMQSIELKVGQSSIKLDQQGVTVKGLNIKVEGQVNAQMKSPMTQINGDGLLELKGGLTTIN